MKIAARLVVIGWLMAISITSPAQETWQSALSRMNCVALMLNAFQSNAIVKALVFMPGATDELYFYRRVHAKVTNANPSLLDTVAALTNQTYIRATFRPPLLLLHTSEDNLDVIAVEKNKSATAKLKRKTISSRIVLEDADWDGVRAAVSKKLSVGLRPFSDAPDSWHFYRHNFAACGVTQWEMLETIALADKTKFTVHWLTADFQLDQRTGVVPDAKGIRVP